MHDHDQRVPIAIPLEELVKMATDVAAAMKAGPEVSATPPATGGGSAHRQLPEELRLRFIDVRAALFQRGIYDPVLVRFDTATTAQASTNEIADRLESVATSLVPTA